RAPGGVPSPVDEPARCRPCYTARVTREALFRKIEQGPWAAHRAWFERFVRPAIAIHVAPGRGRSHFNGSPDLPIGTAWPRHAHGPYRFLEQLDLADVPSRGSLPASGLLCLFVGDDPTGQLVPDASFFWLSPGYALAHYVPDGTPTAPLTPPAEVAFGEEAALTFTETVDLPFDPFQANEWPFDLGDEAAYDALRATLHGREHLFGYPEHQSLFYHPTPEGMVPLLSGVVARRARLVLARRRLPDAVRGSGPARRR
ncbi:MAG: DUF1963 domain-containing protein, partial [Myxococcota bacterium]